MTSERYEWTYAYAQRNEGTGTSRLDDFLALGWLPHDSLANTAHEQHAVLVEWLCDCHCPFPPKVERNTASGAKGAAMKPLAIDLFCGLGGWTEALLAEGYDVVGFDIERHHYGDHRYQAQLVLQDVLTLHGSQFRDAALIVASPPCQAYSYRAMPWKRAKALPPPDNTLFEACFRIQREASAAAGRHVPLIVENVRGAQKWVGRARWNFGSFYLWGDVPALMPMTAKAVKVGGLDWNGYKNGDPNYRGQAFNTHAERNIKNNGGSWFAIAHNTTSGTGSKSPARKFASAMIAKIPAPLARHIARTFKAIQQEWEGP